MSNKFNILWERTQQEIPNAKLVHRQDSWFMRTISWFLTKVLRLNKDYCDFGTTIFSTIYLPHSWLIMNDQEKYKLLRHELIHLRQFRNWPFSFLGRPYFWYVNALFVSFCYIFVLPVLFTMRAKFEKEAYTQSLLVDYEAGRLQNLAYRAHTFGLMVRQFTDSTYAWMSTDVGARLWVLDTYHDIFSGKLTSKDQVA
jgi:hypothetical protein